MLIFIIGYKSSGKTCVGKKLAHNLNLNFIDLDEYIEKINQISVPELYTEIGEENFRMKENEALLKVCQKETNAVVSTGGGAPCWKDNMNIMLKHGATVFLQVDNDTLVQRLTKATADRPIVKGKSEEELHQFVNTMREKRESFYQKAKFHVNAKDISVEDLAARIEKAIKAGNPFSY